jgi:hypothetical protein
MFIAHCWATISAPMDWRESYHVVYFQYDLRHAAIEGLCFLCVVRAERIRENTGMGIDFT